jgi:DNA-binding MurR/RpiR family transcriptional regulator
MNIDDLTKIPHKCAVNLQAVYDNLKTAEKNAADFLLKNPVGIINMTVADFAGEA